MEYCKEYVEELESIANEMAISIENMLSIVSPKREPICGNMGAANQAELILDQYYQLQRDSRED